MSKIPKLIKLATAQTFLAITVLPVYAPRNMPPGTVALPSAFRKAAPSAGARRVPRQRPAQETQMRRIFWSVAALLALVVIVRGYGQAPALSIGAALIIASALLPNYLWITRKATGLPIFPLYALTSIWIHALPLVSKHPIIILFSPAAQMTAALSVCGFLWLGTGAWYLIARRPTKPVTRCWMFDERQKDSLLLVSLAIAFLFMLAISSGWISAELRIFTAVRAVVIALQALLCFGLSYRLGQGRLSPAQRVTFYLLIAGSMIVGMVGLLMFSAMILVGLSAIAYTIGSQKIPWRVCLVSIFVFGFLHNGKAVMRAKYWHDDEFFAVSPLHYPGFLAEWANDSWQIVRYGDPEDEGASLQERASLMHLLLYFQNVSPNIVPFLHGESYKSIPVQFIPRMFYPDKPRSLEGQYVVCVYYDLQTRESTDTLSIEIGLLNEAFANFGFIGMGVLGILLGAGSGLVSNWSRDMPIFSFRTLFAVSVLAGLLGSGTCASMCMATLYQSTIVLLVVTLVFMRPTKFQQIKSTF